MADTEETKRDRVRRLFIIPLEDLGMCFPKATDPKIVQKTLNDFCDRLTYMSDENLIRLRHCLKTKGEGSARKFWPKMITIISFAELAQPRPLKHEPNLLSWFGSDAGKQALEAGRLVAEFLFFERVKRPPLKDSEKRQIAERANGYNSRVLRLEERLGRGWDLSADDAGFLEWYRGRLEYCTKLVNGELTDA